ncbi:MAG: hypothetical protein J6A59_01830 [Lachnospiraceae bacterium]|nr:hypothetical protein [Lachnospiraceae bacterium]
MEKLDYFANENVPMVVTQGVQTKLSQRLIAGLFGIVFQQKEKLNKLGIEMDSLQVFTVEAEHAFDDNVTVYKITLEQEEPKYKSVTYAMEEGGYTFSGKVWVIESWNGKTENVTLDDHYITMLFPSEY